ncbi:hypothetical protein SSX86_014403 [Deinandra increscens subsp. villosa]|uniref:Ubiquitin-like protease family profile domain-containing protein n=1 Tax=Deinandra increscens subsp. villosa TaxID=3103831 RepID=A0AAP0GZT0_9ASTR
MDTGKGKPDVRPSNTVVATQSLSNSDLSKNKHVRPFLVASNEDREVDCANLVDSLQVFSISKKSDMMSSEPNAQTKLDEHHVDDSVENSQIQKRRKKYHPTNQSTWKHTPLRRSGRQKNMSRFSNTLDTAIPVDSSDKDSSILAVKVVSRINKCRKVNNDDEDVSRCIESSHSSKRSLRKRNHSEMRSSKNASEVLSPTLKMNKNGKNSVHKRKHDELKKPPPPKPKKIKWFGIRTRSSPSQFFRCVQILRPNQKAAVRRMGFGQLLTFRVDSIPLRLGHYVVDHFSPDCMVIQVGTRSVEVDSDSIQRLLGVPSGNTKIVEENKLPSRDNHVVKWRSRYDCSNIAPSHMVRNIKAARDEDSFNFRMDFIMCFLSVLVECNRNGRLKEKILDFISGDIDWKDIDWCDYILQSMKSCKELWKPNDINSPFAGPLSILTLLYVDSFECQGIVYDDTKNAISFWSKKLLKQRELLEIRNGGFGKGKYKGLSKVVDDGSNDFTNVDSDFLLTEVQMSIDILSNQKAYVDNLLLNLTKHSPDSPQLKSLMNSYEAILKFRPSSFIQSSSYVDPTQPGSTEDDDDQDDGNDADSSESESRAKSSSDDELGSYNETETTQLGDHDEPPRTPIHRGNDVDIPQLADDYEPPRTPIHRGYQVDTTQAGVFDEPPRTPTHRSLSKVDPAIHVDLNFPIGSPHHFDNDDVILSQVSLEKHYDFSIHSNATDSIISSILGDINDASLNDSTQLESLINSYEAILNFQPLSSKQSSSHSHPTKPASAEDRQDEQDVNVSYHHFETTEVGNDDEPPSKLVQEHVNVSEDHLISSTLGDIDHVTEKKTSQSDVDVAVKESAPPPPHESTPQFLAHSPDKSGAETGPKPTFPPSDALRCSSHRKLLSLLDPDELPKWTLGMTQIPIPCNDAESADISTPQVQSSAANVDNNGGHTLRHSTTNSTDCVSAIQVPFTDSETLFSSIQHPIDAVPISFVPSAEKIEEAVNKLESLRVNPLRSRTYSTVLKSPWFDRAVKIDAALSKEEKQIWDLLFKERSFSKSKQKSKALPAFILPGELIFYSINNVEANKAVMQTLMFDIPVNIVVLEAWVNVLNYDENRRSDDSPARFFCPPTLISSYLLHDHQADDNRRNNAFKESLLQHLDSYPINQDLKGVDMIFLPVEDSESFYLLVFEFKHPAISVIDSSPLSDPLVKLCDSDSYFDKDSAHKMKHIFCNYLKSIGHPKCQQLLSCKIDRLHIDWATSSIPNDNIIFVMRHMEKFMGRKYEFDCHFGTNGMRKKKQLKVLRQKYAAAILLSDVNLLKSKIKAFI